VGVAALVHRPQPQPVYGSCPPLKAFALEYRTSVSVLAPSVSETSSGFVGQLSRLLVRPEVEGGASASVQVLHTHELAGICVTDFDPGPALQLTMQFRRISLQGLRRLFASSIQGCPDTPLTADEFETLCKRGFFVYRGEGNTRVRLGPVRLADKRVGLMEFFRLQLQDVPQASFDANGQLLQLTVRARAMQCPLHATRTDATLGLCGQLIPLSRARSG
jgi:hypothetical protein